MTTQSPVPTEPSPSDGIRTLLIAAWAVPILVLGQFAMLAVVPVVLVAVRTARATRPRALRWWAAVLSAAYATPLLLWAIGPDRARSLSRDMSPLVTAGLVAVAVVVAVAFTVEAVRRRSALRSALVGPETAGSPG